MTAPARIENWRGETVTTGSVAEVIAWVKGYCYDAGRTARLVANHPQVVYRLDYSSGIG